jgi:E3 ubiquitin-protein ligase RNF115/126
MTGLMAALGAPPGSLNAHQHQDGGAEARFQGDNHDHDHNHEHAGSPFFQLFTSLGIPGPGTNMGDFVYSQEGLDRIVSQLMEQTATSNAPPPASRSDIDNLPKKEVDEAMLGPEHTAECSICMDEVKIGEEVTVLPCKHWFHPQCVGAWLIEHDTCPHCRKGISQNPQGQNTQPSTGAQAGSGAQATGSRQMPGAFDDSGNGSSQNPFAVSGDTGAANNNTPASSSDNGGLGDRLRRGLFGAQQ